MGNPAPVFGSRAVAFGRRQRVGTNHVKGLLENGEGGIAAIGFQMADRLEHLGAGPVDAAFRLEQNEFRGQTTLLARLVTLTPHHPGHGAGHAP